MSRRLLLVTVPVVLATAACGGGGSNTASPTPSAPASGTELGGPPPTCSPTTHVQLGAQNFSFDKGCLGAPSGRPFTITFANKDAGVQHNVHILQSGAGGKDLFKGDLVTGVETTTYHVPALPPGRYLFQCDVHPSTMTGTFVVT